MTDGDAGLGFLKGCGEALDLGAGRGACGFLGFRALEAGKFFVFQTAGFSVGESNFVLDGCCLLGSLYGV